MYIIFFNSRIGSIQFIILDSWNEKYTKLELKNVPLYLDNQFRPLFSLTPGVDKIQLDLDVSTLVGDEYVPLVDDTMRMLTLQIIIQFMLMLRSPKEYSMFSESFFELLFYIVLGLMTYWLVIRKLIKIV